MGKTIAEELIEKGRKEGEIRARRHTLLLLLRTRFRKLPQATVDAIETTTDVQQLDEWIERFATAKTLAQMGIDSAD